MKNNTINQYKGYLSTPNLWVNDDVFGLSQFEIDTDYFTISNPENFNEIRLGKRVEQFFEFQIKNSLDHKLIVNNVQVNNKKLTVGELDIIILKNNQPIHIEIVYKFYLYDPNIKTNNEFEKWIGPNRKDTLIYKLTKLKEKQLPLLYSEFCKPILDKLNIDLTKIRQQVCYKAQLFLPLNFEILKNHSLYNKCVYGFYLSFDKIETLKDYELYIPDKLDWLVNPNNNVEWLMFKDGILQIEKFIQKNRSIMVWLKSSEGDFQKCFITYW